MMWLFGIAVLGLIGVATYLILEQQQNKLKRERALALIGTGKTISEDDKKQIAARNARDEIARKLRSAATSAKGAQNQKSIASLITQANLKISVLQYWAFAFVSGTALAALMMTVSGKPLVVILSFVIGVLGLPRMILSGKAKKRQKKFLDDFADALDASARLLKAGMPIGEAIAMCAREYSGPVGDEMRKLYDAQKIGIPLSDAAHEAVARMPIAEMRMLATALVIQQQTGSSLSEVLENLASMIRSRYRLKRKILALSSEATASAAIIGSLPILVVLALKGVNPQYIDLLFTPDGTGMLYFAIGMMVTGILVMKRMINFKI